MSDDVEKKSEGSQSGQCSCYTVEIRSCVKRPLTFAGMLVGEQWMRLPFSGFELEYRDASAELFDRPGLPVQFFHNPWLAKHGYLNWEAAQCAAWHVSALAKATCNIGIEVRVVRCMAVYSFAVSREEEYAPLDDREPRVKKHESIT